MADYRKLKVLVVMTLATVAGAALPFSNKWIGTDIRLVPVCSGDDGSGLPSGLYTAPSDPLYASAIINPFAAFQEVMSRRGRPYAVWADAFEQVTPCQSPGSESGVASDTPPNLFRLVDFIQESNSSAGSTVVGQVARGTPLLGGRLDNFDFSLVRPSQGNTAVLNPLPEPTTCSRASKTLSGNALHELGHVYGFNHDDTAPNLMNTSGIDVFSCRWFGDTLTLKPDGFMMEAMDSIYGRPPGLDVDLGLTAVIRTSPGSMGVPSGDGKSVDGSGGDTYSNSAVPVRPVRLRFTVMRLGGDNEPFDLLVHWTPWSARSFPSPDLGPSMAGSFVQLIPNIPAPAVRHFEMVVTATPPVANFIPNVTYYPVIEVFSGNDHDVFDKS